ncbi:hypothetical protein HOL21_00800 [Candidatus Woesearchaeota archaeon]|jgi:hypothetical protein|nr:hypothetical protein [Candidatus Woesearchaeota archaeon]MBT5396735.1 hypothetical protein [Candidatus Woesearchaeota archaeon]MBT5924597.1 hypothetical protein [Candidatus Woesearchaeota archaeon]MBT6367478.1 hypothetical protein [Candidatus Woesearchaeota archaeon]MBT7762977.1 hypothetical protein [Candidatus Woesearchaeota archaeon]
MIFVQRHGDEKAALEACKKILISNKEKARFEASFREYWMTTRHNVRGRGEKKQIEKSFSKDKYYQTIATREDHHLALVSSGLQLALDDDKEKKLQQLGEAFEKSQDLGKAFGNFFANIRFALPFLIEREDKWKVIASKSLEYIRSNILPHIEKLEIDKEPIKTRLSKIYKQSKNEKLKEFFEALEAIFS